MVMFYSTPINISNSLFYRHKQENSYHVNLGITFKDALSPVIVAFLGICNSITVLLIFLQKCKEAFKAGSGERRERPFPELQLSSKKSFAFHVTKNNRCRWIFWRFLLPPKLFRCFLRLFLANLRISRFFRSRWNQNFCTNWNLEEKRAKIFEPAQSWSFSKRCSDEPS